MAKYLAPEVEFSRALDRGIEKVKKELSKTCRHLTADEAKSLGYTVASDYQSKPVKYERLIYRGFGRKLIRREDV